jgi:hypothetical protein
MSAPVIDDAGSCPTTTVRGTAPHPTGTEVPQ